jgi:heterodisulfide reductase subunit A
VRYLFNGEDPQKELRRIIEKVRANPKIHLFLESKVEAVEGSVGNFKTKIKTKDGIKEVEHGVAIIAVGAKEYKPKEYLYGEDPRVLTQRELEEKLSNEGISSPKTFVMIQCVGSRDEERPYCSRICCNEAVKNALKIKELSPESSVYVLYRDIRTYGFRESYYSKARKEGVAFIRYREDKKPQVSRNGNKIMVSVYDAILGMEVEIPADVLVLSAGVVPHEENKEVAQLFKVPLTQDKFFLEAHIKLRPVDFATEGVFLAGLAHSPKLIEESAIQAQAAAARASTILSHDHLELEANISMIIDENCDGCAYCVEPCPYKAITLLEYIWQGSVKKVAEVNESLCKGCGCCMATCPKRGAMVRGFTLDQISAQINAALEWMEV